MFEKRRSGIKQQLRYYDKSYTPFIEQFKDFDLVTNLDYPVSVNNWIKPFKNRRTGTISLRQSDSASKYKNVALCKFLKLFKLIGHNSRFPLFDKSLSLKISVLVFLPDKRVRDLDNITKILFDSLTYSHVIGDDVQFTEINLKRANFKENELKKKLDKKLFRLNGGSQGSNLKFKYKGGVLIGIKVIEN